MLQFEVNVALSEEDDRQRVRQEIVRSFVYGERAYVALLNSLVQVTIHILRCITDDGAGVEEAVYRAWHTFHTVQLVSEGRIRPMGRVFPGWNHCFKLLPLFRRCWLCDRSGFCHVYLYPQLNLEKLLIRRLSKQALSVCVCCAVDTIQ